MGRTDREGGHAKGPGGLQPSGLFTVHRGCPARKCRTATRATIPLSSVTMVSSAATVIDLAVAKFTTTTVAASAMHNSGR